MILPHLLQATAVRTGITALRAWEQGIAPPQVVVESEDYEGLPLLTMREE